MPAFAQSAGGMLTDEQIDVDHERDPSRWSRPGALDGARSAALRGAAPPATPHGARPPSELTAPPATAPDGEGGAKGSAITNDSFLALVSDQGLRTIVIAGRPELGAPDWRGNVPGRPMSDQEVTDVVAWLASQRVPVPRAALSERRVADDASDVAR